MAYSEKEAMDMMQLSPEDQADVEAMAEVMALQLEAECEAPALLQHAKEKGMEFCLKMSDGRIFDMTGHKLAA